MLLMISTNYAAVNKELITQQIAGCDMGDSAKISA